MGDVVHLAGPQGHRATWLRRQADTLRRDACTLRDEARELERATKTAADQADAAEMDDTATDEAWADLRACRVDQRQRVMSYG